MAALPISTLRQPERQIGSCGLRHAVSACQHTQGGAVLGAGSVLHAGIRSRRIPAQYLIYNASLFQQFPEPRSTQSAKRGEYLLHHLSRNFLPPVQAFCGLQELQHQRPSKRRKEMSQLPLGKRADGLDAGKKRGNDRRVQGLCRAGKRAAELQYIQLPAPRLLYKPQAARTAQRPHPLQPLPLGHIPVVQQPFGSLGLLLLPGLPPPQSVQFSKGGADFSCRPPSRGLSRRNQISGQIFA